MASSGSSGSSRTAVGDQSLVGSWRRHRVLRRGGVCPFIEGARLAPSLVHRRLT
ncbi:MAG: hypothetical protein UX00_C0020G0009 [Microgenomates group bacterium GW2011_GWB1_45_17]|nr:MAG: hypothetical protein UX00_C0020G0009 [Microgenomates group bacterium GW2011_GWB1_45_17]